MSSHLLNCCSHSPALSGAAESVRLRELPYTNPKIYSLAGKSVIVVGGNSGLGWEFARQALILNASKVSITTRSEAKGHAAIAALRDDPEVESSNPKAKLDFLILDLDDYNSAYAFVQIVKHEEPEIDILLCNGGINIFNYQSSTSGHERVMQVNAYTHCLIVLSLLPLLQSTAAKRGSPSRVTFVSSFSHMKHTMNSIPVTADQSILDYLDDRTKHRGIHRYQDSKLVVNAFVQRLATIIPSTGVIINSVCPGVVATDFHRHLPCWFKPVMSIYCKIHAKPVSEGGRALIHAAVVAGPESHGRYLQRGEIHSGAAFLSQPAGKRFMEKLWAEVVAEFRKIDPSLGIYS